MAYVQAFTGTHGPAEQQRVLYHRILDAHGFDALSIGTRPDCLPPETLAVLEQVRRRVDLWVELGVQTIHDETLRRIGRGHDWACSRSAILDLARRDIRVVAHVILGLPRECAAHFRQTAEALAPLSIQGVKIHNLHVIRGTRLAREFERDPFPVPDERAYAEILIDFLRRLPATVAVLRINTDSPGQDLLAPRWTMTKGRFRDYVIGEMNRRGIRQGDLAAVPAEGGTRG
jgi:radical SAM protein (TIGR01212 family)